MAKQKKAAAVQATEQPKTKNALKLLDLRNNKLLIRSKGPLEIEIEKMISWDNTNGQRGVMANSYLSIVLKGPEKEKKLVIGKTGANIWMGEAIQQPVENKEEILDI